MTDFRCKVFRSRHCRAIVVDIHYYISRTTIIWFIWPLESGQGRLCSRRITVLIRDFGGNYVTALYDLRGGCFQVKYLRVISSSTFSVVLRKKCDKMYSQINHLHQFIRGSIFFFIAKIKFYIGWFFRLIRVAQN